jgi:hypothetical protein
MAETKTTFPGYLWEKTRAVVPGLLFLEPRDALASVLSALTHARDQEPPHDEDAREYWATIVRWLDRDQPHELDAGERRELGRALFNLYEYLEQEHYRLHPDTLNR